MPVYTSSNSRWEGQRVGGYGSAPNRVMLVGERPGLREAQLGRPFVGPTGDAQRNYFATNGLDVDDFYATNLVKDYHPANADPTESDVALWEPELREELELVQPKLVITVGRFSSRWFLGEVDMRTVHGIAHRCDKTDAVVIPVYHPSWGLHDPEARPIISYDYRRASYAIMHGATPPIDEYKGRENYRDVTGAELTGYLRAASPRLAMGLDTEGYPRAPWSIQVSIYPGTGWVLRCSQPDFATGIAAIRNYALSSYRPIVAMHNAMYDLEMCRAMGLDLFTCNLFDSMYAAYLLRVEPQGLKALAYRWCGMAMQSYADTVGGAALENQLEWLATVAGSDWSKPEPRVVDENDGTSHLYTPTPVGKRAQKILMDCLSGKVNKDGEPADPEARWAKVDDDQRATVEAVIGAMPRASLADVPLPVAVHYSGRDPDATLRLYRSMAAELKSMGLTALMARGMATLPVFEEMQSSGMPASRSYFAGLYEELDGRMRKLQSRISHRYFKDEPFNPASPIQVAELMKKQGVKGAKYNRKTKRTSTAKKSIEHLRSTNSAISDVMDWREMQKNRDSFCAPLIAKIPPDGPDVAPVNANLKITRVATRRLAASDPNLLAMPTRNEEGVRIRSGFVAPGGYVFGSWDLSQVEMRYMAHLSEDPLLIRFFNEKRDVHAETAARIFRIPLNKVEEMAHRYPAKRAGFGIITNITGSGLFDQLRMFGCKGWDEKKCDQLVADWLGVYGGVSRFLDECREEARTNGIVYDCWGMPRYLPNVWTDDRRAAAEDERAASSHKIQGGAQGMIQNSMAWLKPHIAELRDYGDVDIRWRLQIHDELIFTFPEWAWDLMDGLVIEALTKHHGLDSPRVPITAKGSCAKTWGGLKG